MRVSHWASRLGRLSLRRRRTRVEPLVLASSLAELVADSARLADVQAKLAQLARWDLEGDISGPGMRYVAKGDYVLYDDVAELFAARSLPETTDNG